MAKENCMSRFEEIVVKGKISIFTVVSVMKNICSMFLHTMTMYDIFKDNNVIIP